MFADDTDASFASEYVNCNFVNSRGINYSCDLIIKTESHIKFALANHVCASLREGAVVFVKMDVFLLFVNVLFPTIPFQFTLVTGNSDIMLPNDIFATTEQFWMFANNDKIRFWFAQNCTEFHPKVLVIPIGIDYHSLTCPVSAVRLGWSDRAESPLEQDLLLWTTSASAPALEDRALICYVNFQFTMDTRFGRFHRKSALDDIPAELLFVEPAKLTRIESWNRQCKMAFVVCPYGNGLDTHRVWEALALGCIAIVKQGPFSSMYNGLRVLSVKNWRDITPELLRNTVEQFSKLNPNSEALTLRYWTSKFRVRNCYAPNVYM